MLKEPRQKLGTDIHCQKDKDGSVRGYGIADHKTKMMFDGSRCSKRVNGWTPNPPSQTPSPSPNTRMTSTSFVLSSTTLAVQRCSSFLRKKHVPTCWQQMPKSANGSNSSSPSSACSKLWEVATTRTGNGKLEMVMMAMVEEV